MYRVTLSPAQKNQIAELYVQQLLWGAGEVIIDGTGLGRFEPGEPLPGAIPRYDTSKLADLPEGWQELGEDAQRLVLKEAGVYNEAAWQQVPEEYAKLDDIADPEAMAAASSVAAAGVEAAIQLVAQHLPDYFYVEKGKLLLA